MVESTKQILELVYQNKSVNEITEELNISRKKLYYVLRQIKNNGYEINRKYYYNGDIIYTPKTSFISKKGVDIITSKTDNNFEALVISDLHIGSSRERLDSLNAAYNYCIKNGINIIIVCGDIIDGMYGPYPKHHTNINDQIEYAIKNYPFDKNILNFATLGDHDYDAMKKYGINFATILENYRHDIIPLGYCIGQINIKNDILIVRHPSNKFKEVKLEPMNKTLTLCGHSHKMKYSQLANTTIINIPTLSDLPGSDITRPPSAIHMNLAFKNGVIYYGNFSQVIFDKNPYIISEFECYLGYGKDISGNNPIGLEEERSKVRTLEPNNIQPKEETAE